MGLFKFLKKVLFGILGFLGFRKKKKRPDSTIDFEDPTAEAGRPVPVPFGTIMVKGGNNRWFGDKQTRRSKINA